jgi:hypothetical protein
MSGWAADLRAVLGAAPLKLRHEIRNEGDVSISAPALKRARTLAPRPWNSDAAAKSVHGERVRSAGES